MTVKKKVSYSEAVQQIESILTKIEKDELDVDQLAENVKEVSQLIAFCKEKLYQTEEEVNNILKEMGES
ncbi:MAG: exodeoxyribonuclease VII small subunit [Bacteroidales bacterium]|nr:exodeoxyribonuclease VII small subunit [Bacteroidales bacterium]